MVKSAIATAAITSFIIATGSLNVVDAGKDENYITDSKKGDYVMKFWDVNGEKQKIDFGEAVRIPKGKSGKIKKSKSSSSGKAKASGFSGNKFGFHRKDDDDECNNESGSRKAKQLKKQAEDAVLPYWTHGDIIGSVASKSSYYPVSHYNTHNTDSTLAPGPNVHDKLSCDILTDYDFMEKTNKIDIASDAIDSSVKFESHKQWEEESGFKKLEHELISDGLLAPITLCYNKNNTVVWGSSFTHIMKIYRGENKLQKVATYQRPNWGHELFVEKDLFHGSYAVLNDDIYYSPSRKAIYAYGDACEGDHQSGIVLIKKYDIPLDENDGVRGLSVDSSGNLVYVTQKGKVGIIEIVGGTITDITPLLPPECENAEISNNFAVTDYQNIESAVYVTDKCMVRVELNPSGPGQPPLWATSYVEEDAQPIHGRLGAGSGTTPSIIEACNGSYVVIGDGEKKMNYILFDLADGSIVAKDKIHFGHPEKDSATTEQSILVHNNKFTATSNSYKDYSYLETHGNGMETLIPIYKGDNPRGLHTFELVCTESGDELDYVTTKWVNKDVSIPNGITTASIKDNKIYGIGKRDFRHDDIANFQLQTKAKMEDYFYNKIASPEHLSQAGKLAAFSKYSQENNHELQAAGVFNSKAQDVLIANDLLNEDINKELSRKSKSGSSGFHPVTDEDDVPDHEKISLWTLECVDSEDGEKGNWFQILGAGLKYNSAYAACEIGPDKEILSGTALGIIRIKHEEGRKETKSGDSFGPHNGYPKYQKKEDGKFYEVVA